jgi:hypothetical protein
VHPLSIAGIVTAVASLACGLTLLIVTGGAGPLVVAVVGAALGGGLFLAGKRTQTAGPAAPAPTRFEAAFKPTKVASKDGAKAVGRETLPMDGPSIADQAEPGASTMAVRFVPDTSVAPIPGFQDVYRKIACGEIKGHIMVVGGPDRGRGVDVRDGTPITVGRDKDHTLILTDAGVSNHQCEFVAAEGRLVLRDAGSKNGTYVNNTRVDRHVLENCDIVTLGSTKILVTLPG